MDAELDGIEPPGWIEGESYSEIDELDATPDAPAGARSADEARAEPCTRCCASGQEIDGRSGELTSCRACGGAGCRTSARDVAVLLFAALLCDGRTDRAEVLAYRAPDGTARTMPRLLPDDGCGCTMFGAVACGHDRGIGGICRCDCHRDAADLGRVA